MTKENQPTRVTGMSVLIEEGAKLEPKNPKAAGILYEATLDLAKKVGDRKKEQSTK